MLRYRLHPLRLNAGGNAAPQPAGLHQFRHHRPLRRLFKQTGPRENGKAGVARPGKLLFIGILHADVRQQTGQQRGMDLAIFRWLAVDRQAKLLHHLAQLGIDILPLAHAQIVQIIDPALTAELIRRQGFLLFAEIVPQVHKGEEVRLFIVKAAVFFVRGLLFVHRPLARILNRQRGGDDHRFSHAAVLLRLQHHPRQTRVYRQLAKLTAHRGQLVGGGLLIGGDGAQLFQQAHAVLNVALIRRFNEREGGDIA